MKLIPLHGQDGSVRALAKVDDADYPALTAYRWSLHDAGYAQRGSNGRIVYMHRQLLGLKPGDAMSVDHINRDGLDNRRANLRIATHRQNHQNRGSKPGSSSRFRGVYWNKTHRKWMARVRFDYVQHYLGTFTDEVEAARACEAFRRAHMPFAQPDPELLKLDEPTPLRPAA